MPQIGVFFLVKKNVSKEIMFSNGGRDWRKKTFTEKFRQ